MTPENDPRMKMFDELVEQNKQADLKYEREQQEGADAAEEAAAEQEWDLENEACEKEQEDENALFTSQEEIDDFCISSKENGGIADLTSNKNTEQQFIDERDLLVAQGGEFLDRRIWEKAGDRVRKIQELPEDQAKREINDIQIRAKRYREMIQGNTYCEPGAEPVGERETKMRFMLDHPTLSGRGINEARENVDTQKDAQFIEQGYVTNEWEKYDKAGEHAEQQDYLRMRNQEE